jgi:hypothetical protein
MSTEGPDQPVETPRFLERHYAVAEISDIWGLSPQVVRELFEREPGVLVIGDKPTFGKRRYRTLRIPATVMERVHRRLSNPELALANSRRKRYDLGRRDHPLLETTGGP